MPITYPKKDFSPPSSVLLNFQRGQFREGPRLLDASRGLCEMAFHSCTSPTKPWHLLQAPFMHPLSEFSFLSFRVPIAGSTCRFSELTLSPVSHIWVSTHLTESQPLQDRFCISLLLCKVLNFTLLLNLEMRRHQLLHLVTIQHLSPVGSLKGLADSACRAESQRLYYLSQK